MAFSRVRPAQDAPVPSGEHAGIIMDAIEKTLPSKFHSSGEREVLSLQIRIFLPDSEPHLFYTVNWDWKNRSFTRLLYDLGVLPERGQAFDPESLAGLDVVATVSNAEKDGVTYSNIISLRRLTAETDTTPYLGRDDAHGSR